jgi:putative transposase
MWALAPGLNVSHGETTTMHFAPQETRTYQVTATTSQRRRLFQVTATANLMQQILLDYRHQGKYELYAFVIMPDHIHVLFTPAPEVSLEKAVQFIKGGFSFRLKSKLEVWTRSFNQTQIQTAEQFNTCRTYIEANPIRKRIVSSPEEFLYSSACRRDTIDSVPPHLRG